MHLPCSNIPHNFCTTSLCYRISLYMYYIHQNKKCKEVATEEFLKGRFVLLLEIERPLSISHVFSKQSVFYFIKLSALFFSPPMLYFIFNPSLLFLPVYAGEISLCHVFLFLTVFWPLPGEQCCTFFTIHISMIIFYNIDKIIYRVSQKNVYTL